MNEPRQLGALALGLLLASTAAAQKVPDMKPGETCEQLRADYGKESSVEGPAHIWKGEVAVLRVLVKPNGPCVAGEVEYEIQPGHTYTTRDGIVLGRDTFAQAIQKLKGRIDANNYMFIRGEGKAYGQIILPRSASYPFESTYSWQLRPAAADKLNGPPQLSDFSNETAVTYSLWK